MSPSGCPAAPALAALRQRLPALGDPRGFPEPRRDGARLWRIAVGRAVPVLRARGGEAAARCGTSPPSAFGDARLLGRRCGARRHMATASTAPPPWSRSARSAGCARAPIAATGRKRAADRLIDLSRKAYWVRAQNRVGLKTRSLGKRIAMAKARILIVEDEPNIVESLSFILRGRLRGRHRDGRRRGARPRPAPDPSRPSSSTSCCPA